MEIVVRDIAFPQWDDGGGCPVSVEPWGAAAIPATTDQTFPGQWSTRHQFLVAMSAIRRIGGDRWMKHPSTRFSHRIERERITTLNLSRCGTLRGVTAAILTSS